MRLTPEQEDHVIDHANKLVVLLHDDDINLDCPMLYAALLELADWLQQTYQHPEYCTGDLIEQFLREHESEPEREILLPEELEDIEDEDDIDPGPITH